ncbi:DUF3310 domain-containing protein [Mammaliicoccus sciuri]|uniref:DUF3310 domain-containing protein n=1 Tax=Mammaliicoccus sciuri TaxID=1296 RepID=UPI002DB979FF|nr:DUF3310 domain-containing protein [Mammaliicoccus sciuri]MEB6231423.1 DUF3310 domain-containing protein [Mammaliicoccus sciuri]
MEFKAGDRVHVTRFESNDVDFYATLTDTGLGIWELVNCSDCQYEGRTIYKETENKFGIDKEDYYTLATDEEDTEEPEVQRISDVVLNTSSTKFIEKAIKDNLNRIEEIMYNDVPDHYKADIDVIEFCRQHFTDEEFKGAMKFNLIKYPTRLGRKDDIVKELDKIIDYAQRYKEVLEGGITK